MVGPVSPLTPSKVGPLFGRFARRATALTSGASESLSGVGDPYVVSESRRAACFPYLSYGDNSIDNAWWPFDNRSP